MEAPRLIDQNFRCDAQVPVGELVEVASREMRERRAVEEAGHGHALLAGERLGVHFDELRALESAYLIARRREPRREKQVARLDVTVRAVVAEHELGEDLTLLGTDLAADRARGDLLVVLNQIGVEENGSAALRSSSVRER